MLKQWQSAAVSTQQVWDWASHRFQAGHADYDDRDGSESVAHEMLSMLDSLDMHFMLVEDVPLHLAFLQTPLGAFEEGYSRWRHALAGIDIGSRKQMLRNDPVYALHCD